MSAVSAKFLKDINETLGGVEKIQGKQGVGITSVKQTSSSQDSGGKNTITVTLDNGNTSTFDIYNGKQGGKGDQGIQGIQGVQGPTGKTPSITIDATVNDSSGTPSVSVDKDGTAEAPQFRLDFSGLKGDSLAAEFNNDYYLIIKNATTGEELSRQYVRGAQGETGAKGDPGDAFVIAAVYNSVSALNSALSQGGLSVGKFYMIDTGSVEDEDTGKLYTVKLNSSAKQELSYITDLSGAQGIQGVSIKDIVQTVTSTEDDGYNEITVYTNAPDGSDIPKSKTFKVKNGSKGSTPTISATATVDSNTATSNNAPSCTVSRTDNNDDKNPAFKFDFKNIVGKTGTSVSGITSTATTDANGRTSTTVNIKKDDGTYKEFTISDGVGIKSITQTPNTESGGTSTINIIKTDGKTDTLSVKNGIDGIDGTSITHSWSGTTLNVTSASETSSADLKGDTGRGIKTIDITQSSASGGKTPMTINYTDNSTPTSLYVLNGKDGKGIASVTAAKSGGTTTVTIKYTEGDDTVFTISDGTTPDTSNFATLNTEQSFTEKKTFSAGLSATTIDTTSTITSSSKITGASFLASSDRRLKTNLRPASFGDICSLPVYKFDFVNGDKNQIGCMAQDLQEICPEIVNEGENGYLSIQESKIVYLLLEEVKALKEEVRKLKGE